MTDLTDKVVGRASYPMTMADLEERLKRIEWRLTKLERIVSKPPDSAEAFHRLSERISHIEKKVKIDPVWRDK